MRKPCDRMISGLAAYMVVAGCATAFGGGLEPGDIAVVYNANSTSSLTVARYYLNARKIPVEHLIPLNCPVSETVTEQLYRLSIVPQLRKTLGDRKLLADEKAGVKGIKCLVTTFDVPLKIAAYEPTVVERAEVTEYQKQLDELVTDIAAQIPRFESLAAVPKPPVVPPATKPATTTSTTTTTSKPATATAPAKPTLSQLLPKVQDALIAAGNRVEKLSEPERSRNMTLLVSLIDHVAGMNGVFNTIAVPADAVNADASRKRLADLSAQLREALSQYQALLPQKDQPRVRKEIVAQRLKTEGVIGQARALEEMIAYLKPEQTGACLDNELALLQADQKYSRAGWLPNPLNLENYQMYQRAGAPRPPAALMICRLDGSSVAKVQEMIDTGLKVEEKGLEGKFYLDGRGLKGKDGYSEFDIDIRKTAEWMKAHATIETVHEDTSKLLVAQDAPDAALYCGWYSVANYQESCQWVKGAVGYHVASFEMVSLHNPNEHGWVVNLLNRGFCGTLGPTDEPYLHSFPKPSLFFPLLLSGEFTQGEVWAVTSPLVSWRQGYVGDPLYNPFQAKPRVKLEDLKADAVLRNAFVILGHEKN